jgi:hypothetical protein
VRRTLPPLLLALALALAGCGTADTSSGRLERPQAAEPQRAALGWREFHPARVGERLVFEVATLAVTRDGWSAAVTVVNRTNLRFEVETGPADYSFGLMLFATGDLKTVEEANRQGELPAIRRARTVEPPPPRFLQPGETWQATLSAPGSLVDGSWARVVFGTFLAVGEAPDEFERVVWFTDHAYRL